MPPVVTQQSISVTRPGEGGAAETAEIPNPLFSYRFQETQSPGSVSDLLNQASELLANKVDDRVLKLPLFVGRIQMGSYSQHSKGSYTFNHTGLLRFGLGFADQAIDARQLRTASSQSKTLTLSTMNRKTSTMASTSTLVKTWGRCQLRHLIQSSGCTIAKSIDSWPCTKPLIQVPISRPGPGKSRHSVFLPRARMT